MFKKKSVSSLRVKSVPKKRKLGNIVSRVFNKEESLKGTGRHLRCCLDGI